MGEVQSQVEQAREVVRTRITFAIHAFTNESEVQ